MGAELSASSPWRKRRVTEANERYAAFLALGYPLVDHPGETLQCRNELDRTNWFELRDSCREAIAAERAFYEAQSLPVPEVLGNYPIPDPGIRCTSNAFIRPTVAQTLEILAGLKAWAMAGQANNWRQKDQVRAAVTRADLDAIDLEEGWP